MNGREYFDKFYTDKLIVKIFEELCRRVGTTLEELEFKKSAFLSEGWEFPIDAYEWSEEEYEDFKKWMVDYVYKNKTVLGHSHFTKKIIKERVVPEWGLMYAWRFKKKENIDE